MEKNTLKVFGSLAAVLTAGTIFAGCETTDTVTVAAGPGGSAVIIEECEDAAACPQSTKAKCTMQPQKCVEKDTHKSAVKQEDTVKVSRHRTCPMAEFENEASKLASTLAHAFKNGDAKAFVAALPENLRKKFDEKQFLEAHKMLTDAMGEVVSADFVTDLKHPLLSIRLWKIGFKKIDKDSGELIQQVLFQVTIGEVDKKAQVISFGFI